MWGLRKRKSQINSVYRFLCELSKKADSLGRSRIGIAFTQMRSDKDKSSTPETSKNDLEPWAREFSAKCREKEKEPLLSLHELQPQEKLYQALRKKDLGPRRFSRRPQGLPGRSLRLRQGEALFRGPAGGEGAGL